MAFMPSVAPDVSESLPFLLGAVRSTTTMREAGAVEFDCYVGDVGFRLAPTDNRPYRRQTARSQKEQFDNSPEAGEQTLNHYWIRSQTSWHLGAGIVNYEPGAERITQHRFTDSLGVDVWHEGDVTLLRATELAGATGAGNVYVTGAVVGGEDVVFANQGGTVYRREGDGTGTAYTAGTILSRVAVAGSKILGGTATTIAVADATGSSWAGLWTAAPAAPTPYWVKSRIIATAAASLYELTLVGGAWPATPLYTHPDSAWTWSAVAEGPESILAAGYSNGVSAIYRFSLQQASSGSTPELSQAFQVAEFPPGEEVHALHVYLGRYIGIGTTKGLRVGIITDGGQIQYGPLIVETTNPVTAITAGDRFLYAAVTRDHPDGNSGAVRVDLSTDLDDGSLRFPYAWDARTGTAGQATGIALLGVSDRVCLGVASEGLYIQSEDELEESGYLTMGRIRYGTVESKAFRAVDVTSTIPAGTIGVEALERDGDAYLLGILSADASNGMGIAISRPPGTHEFLSFRLSLTRGSADPTIGPTLESVQVKAVPTPKRQRLIQVPLLCFDHEQDRQGTPYGYEGFGLLRLQALEEVEDFNAVVTFTDNTSGETFEALIEQTTFEAATPSDPNYSRQGYLELLLRKL